MKTMKDVFEGYKGRMCSFKLIDPIKQVYIQPQEEGKQSLVGGAPFIIEEVNDDHVVFRHAQASKIVMFIPYFLLYIKDDFSEEE